MRERLQQLIDTNEFEFLKTMSEEDIWKFAFAILYVFAEREERCRPMWIPVSDRLPEDAYGCLVTVYDTDLRTQDEFENILPYFVGYDGETWNNADGEPIPFEVIAWMPLPKPYKLQESEDKE